LVHMSGWVFILACQAYCNPPPSVFVISPPLPRLGTSYVETAQVEYESF